MSILIKGMEMPQDCWHCEFFKTTAEGGFSCNRNHKQYDWDLEGRPSDCPLIEVPNGNNTNADRIRAMSDEELCDEYFRILNHQLGNYTDSRLGLLEWLKEEAER